MNVIPFGMEFHRETEYAIQCFLKYIEKHRIFVVHLAFTSKTF